MAKVWKPKLWDAKNPPDSGSRVFVGRANGASSYETISTGQTKRILQSNGRGNIFYGNVTVYYSPLEPALTSNLPVGDYSSQGVQPGHACNVWLRLLPKGATTGVNSVAYRTSDNFNFREATIVNLWSTSTDSDNFIGADAPGSCTNALALANKITIYVDNSLWYIANIVGRTAKSSSNFIGYDITRAYVMALSGGLDPAQALNVRDVTLAINRAINDYISGGSPTVRIILSNEPTWDS